MEDNNIFDEDDALDYIMFKEHEQGDKQPGGSPGCLSVLLIFIIPNIAIFI